MATNCILQLHYSVHNARYYSKIRTKYVYKLAII